MIFLLSLHAGTPSNLKKAAECFLQYTVLNMKPLKQYTGMTYV